MRCAVLAAGLCTAMVVHAQSTVLLYGAVDTGLLIQSSAASSFSTRAPNTGRIIRLKDDGINSSIWGLKGREDLGGGWAATFQLESSFDSSTGRLGIGDTPGVPAIFGRIATVGMTSPFGSINVGRQIAPMFLALASTDVRQGRYFGSILTALIGVNTAAGWTGASTNAPLGSVYDSNAIVYRSPNVGGFSATLEYVVGGVAGSIQGNSRQSAILQFDNYGLKLSAIYYNAHDANPAANSTPTGLDNDRLVSFGALYAYRGVTASATYVNTRNPSRPSAADFEIISGGLGYAVTPFMKLTSGVYFLRDANHSSNRSIEYVFGADYYLSKATMLYADVAHVRNRGAMNQGFVYAQPVAAGIATTAGMVGIRHTF